MAIDTVVEEVATNLEEVAQATRAIDKVAVRYFFGGVAVGFALGFYWGYKFNKEKLKAEAFKKSEEEVEQIRSEYRQKLVANLPKPAVEEVMEEKGYERPLPAPVPITDYTPPKDPPIRQQDIGWNWPEELQNRETGGTYVVHQDEFGERNKDGYTQQAYTYYAGDGILTDEDESRLPMHVVGQENLKFGHGSDDENVVFVRNEKLEIDMEICRTPQSWEEEVLGEHGNENA